MTSYTTYILSKKSTGCVKCTPSVRQNLTFGGAFLSSDYRKNKNRGYDIWNITDKLIEELNFKEGLLCE